MSAADYVAYDFWNSPGSQQYLQQKANQTQQSYYRDPATYDGHVQEAPAQFNYNGVNYGHAGHEQQQPDVSVPVSTQFLYENYPSTMSTSRLENQDNSPKLRALLTVHTKQDCNNYYRQEEHTESSCDHKKMVLSTSSERNSDSDPESETGNLQPLRSQFYPWMRKIHGMSNQLF